jgi:predicted dehydrogenase
MDEIGVAVLGTGWVAGEHIKSLQKIAGCRVAGLCSRTRAGAEAKAKETGAAGARIFDSFEEMLADPSVQAVSICTPPNQHPHQVVQAARAGKHLLIEKAVANDPRSLGDMLRAVRESGVKSVVSFVLHWNPEFLWIKRMLDEGTIGKIFAAEVDYWHNIGPHYAQYRWNVKRDVAGSALLSAGCHAVDALRWFVGDEVEEVSAYSNKQNPEYEYDTNIVGILRFRNGAVGKTSTSLDVKSPYAFNVDLLGEKGTIRDNRIYAKDFFGGQTDWIEVPTIRPDNGDVSHHPFDGELSHFIETVRSGVESPLNLEDAAKTHAVCYALDRSAAERRPVRLDEIDAEIG